MAAEDFRQVHILLPVEMYEDVRTRFPEKGMLSFIIRRLLRVYLDHARLADAGDIDSFKISDVADVIQHDLEKFK